jgi:hypothetical protein
MEVVRCPQCAATARIVDRFTLASTDGPLEHVKLECPNGHWLTPPAAQLSSATRV